MTPYFTQHKGPYSSPNMYVHVTSTYFAISLVLSLHSCLSFMLQTMVYKLHLNVLKGGRKKSNGHQNVSTIDQIEYLIMWHKRRQSPLSFTGTCSGFTANKIFIKVNTRRCHIDSANFGAKETK